MKVETDTTIKNIAKQFLLKCFKNKNTCIPVYLILDHHLQMFFIFQIYFIFLQLNLLIFKFMVRDLFLSHIKQQIK